MRPVFNHVKSVSVRKGAISATAVFIVISVAITGLAMNISINTVVGSFQESSSQSSLNWFQDNIAVNAKELCKSSKEGRVTPVDTSYSKSIPGMESIELDVKTNSNYAAQTQTQRFLLGFGGDDTQEAPIESITTPGNSEFSCDTIEFNGTASGNEASGLNPGATYNYRLFSDGEGEVTIQIKEAQN